MCCMHPLKDVKPMGYTQGKMNAMFFCKKTHEHNVDHKHSMPIWEAQDGAPIGPMPQHLVHIIDKTHLWIITYVKILHFIMQKKIHL